MKKGWIIGFFTTALLLITGILWNVIEVDPFFHFHAPHTDRYFYLLDNQRSQNDGITRHFTFQGLITGTSMAENARTSEAEELFGVPFVKVCYEGGTFSEINASLEAAIRRNPDLKYVIRGLDMDMFFDDKDRWRTDLGKYPLYLYDEDPFNDVEYVLNRDILFSRVFPMKKASMEPSFQAGITSFDEYSNWMKEGFIFGAGSVLAGQNIKALSPDRLPSLSAEEKETIRSNIQHNVVALARENPQIRFYCFFPPYSAVWWYASLANGDFQKRLEAERIAVEEILRCDNIRLYSFNLFYDITTNLNNYKDMDHYGEWINSAILRFLWEGKGLLSSANYQDYLEEERRFYANYDYTQLVNQENSFSVEE